MSCIPPPALEMYIKITLIIKLLQKYCPVMLSDISGVPRKSNVSNAHLKYPQFRNVMHIKNKYYTEY